MTALSIVAVVNPFSAIAYFYFFALGLLFFSIFDRAELRVFSQAYLFNACLTCIYVLLQVHFYPDAYGCTSPRGLQTDDSFFFSLVADEVPAYLETRPDYFLYSQSFSEIVKFLTPFPVSHPLDVLFFSSVIAGIVCVYTRQFAIQLTSSEKVGQTAYMMCQFCPFLLMNGGAVFVRDTFVAALFMLSLCCINRRRFVSAISVIVLQFILRPGTGLIVMPLYGWLYAGEFKRAFHSRSAKMRLIFVLFLFAGFSMTALFEHDKLLDLLAANNIHLDEFTRGGIENIVGDSGRGAFVWVQQQPWYLRMPLATVYMYLVPFFSPTGLTTESAFDTRLLLMDVVYPLWVVPIHAWVIASLVLRWRLRSTMVRLWTGMLLACFLIGAVSFESRHKTLIQPLFYVLAASGLHFASNHGKQIGYFISLTWLLVQVVYHFSGA